MGDLAPLINPLTCSSSKSDAAVVSSTHKDISAEKKLTTFVESQSAFILRGIFLSVCVEGCI